MAINEVRIEGNITADPQARDVAGKTVLNFGIAYNTRHKDDSGQWVDGKPMFFEIEFWPGDPQYWLKRLGKGVGVVVFGSMKQDTWEHEGKTMSKVKVRADTVVSKWLSEIGTTGSASGASSTPDTAQGSRPPDMDALPF